MTIPKLLLIACLAFMAFDLTNAKMGTCKCHVNFKSREVQYFADRCHGNSRPSHSLKERGFGDETILICYCKCIPRRRGRSSMSHVGRMGRRAGFTDDYLTRMLK